MAVITPDTYVKLVRFDATKEHQLTFSNVTAQTNFFNNLTGLVLSDFTYQRKDNVIRYPALYEDIEKYNYLIYRNEAQSNKTYYCYITDLKYINDEMTEIKIETDVFQTWQFDIIYKQMFVEREHVNNDTIGLNTTAESLDTGEYILDSIQQETNLSTVCYILQVTEFSDRTKGSSTNFGGVPMTGGAYVFDKYSDLKAKIAEYVNANVSQDAIINAYCCPKDFVVHDFYNIDNPLYNPVYDGQDNPVTYVTFVNKPTSLNGYVPKNNKLFTFPYCYLLLSNNLGNSNIMHYEKFLDSSCYFEIEGVPVTGGSIKCTPINYGKTGMFQEEGIILGKYPTLNWSKDNYAQWLLSNGTSQRTKAYGGALTGGLGLGLLVGSIITGGTAMLLTGAGMAIGGLGTLASVFASDYEHSLVPNSAQGNSTGGDIASASGNNTFFYYGMSIKAEFAERIDNYFSMVGYKVNQVKIPNITGRTNWNYVKTIDCNIEGTDIPESDLNELKKMFNAGITFWHNYSTFRDYSQSNTIVT